MSRAWCAYCGNVQMTFASSDGLRQGREIGLTMTCNECDHPIMPRHIYDDDEQVEKLIKCETCDTEYEVMTAPPLKVGIHFERWCNHCHTDSMHSVIIS